jgi:hypothetical protein
VQPFDKIKIAGAWEVKIKIGNQYHLQIIAAPETKQFIDVENKNGQLHLRRVKHAKHFWSNDQCLAEITLPKLNSIYLLGASDVVFDGFQSENFVIVAIGASVVYGKNNVFKNLNLKSSGASKFDLLNSKVKNADVKITGASIIKLNMTGGTLIGKVAGASEILYTGSIYKQDISVFGPSLVKPLN